MEEKEFKKLLHKYLKGKASEKEIELIKKFEQQAQNKNDAFDRESPEVVEQRIFSKVKNRLVFARKGWLKIAAGLFIILGLGVLGQWLGTGSNYKTISNNTQQVKYVNLLDGTKVILNKSSQLQYELESYNKEVRAVELEGEAFFEVAKDKEKPFIVSSGDISTTVLGTSFNIQEKKDRIEVTVVSGKVKVSSKKTKDEIILFPEEQAITQESGEFSKQYTNSDLFTSWWKKEVYLEDIGISDFIKLLSARFDIEPPQVNNIFAEHYISIRIRRSDSLEQILKRFNYISQIQIIKNQGNEIKIVEAK